MARRINRRATLLILILLGMAITAIGAFTLARIVGGNEENRRLRRIVERNPVISRNLPKWTKIYELDLSIPDLTGIACGSDGLVYVCGRRVLLRIDPADKRVERFNITGNPTSIAVGKNGIVYLGMGDHIELYTSGGSRSEVWASLGERSIITSVAGGNDGIFVADAGSS